MAIWLGGAASGGAGVASADDTAQAQSPVAPSRQGLLVGAGVELGGAARGLVGQLHGHLGWMVTPRLGVFGTALVGKGVGWEMATYHLEGAGLRVWWSDTWFLGGRAGWAHTAVRDEGDALTERTSGAGYVVEAGAEGVIAGVGLDAHVMALRAGELTAVLLGVGVSYY